jgi:hypothetical protein
MSRARRILKKTGILLGLLLLVFLVVNAILVWITGNRLEERLAALRAAGQPVVFSDLKQPQLPAEQNAGTYLDRANSEIQSFTKEVEAIRFKPEYSRYELSAEDRKSLSETFRNHPTLLPLLHQAADCPNYQSGVDYTLGTNAALPALAIEAQRCRSVINVLDARVRLLLAETKADEALNESIIMLRLASRFSGEPMIIGQLVAIACRAVALENINRSLRSGSVADETRKALDAELAAAESETGYLFALRSECAFGMSAFRDQVGNSWFTRAYFNDDQAYEIEVINRFVDLIGKPYSEVKAFESEFKAGAGSWRHCLSLQLTPALFKFRGAHDRNLALIRCLRVFNAIQTHRPPGKPTGTGAKGFDPSNPGALDDEYEPDLASLGLPVTATIDPFSGELLRVKKVAKGWIVYAVGENLKDDGGEFDGRKDVGVGPIDK